MVEKKRLMNVNTTEKCRGKYSSVREEAGTTIDYVLADDRVWEKMERMEIDQERDIDVRT